MQRKYDFKKGTKIWRLNRLIEQYFKIWCSFVQGAMKLTTRAQKTQKGSKNVIETLH